MWLQVVLGKNVDFDIVNWKRKVLHSPSFQSLFCANIEIKSANAIVIKTGPFNKTNMQEIPQSLAFSTVKSVLCRTEELIFKRIMG